MLPPISRQPKVDNVLHRLAVCLGGGRFIDEGGGAEFVGLVDLLLVFGRGEHYDGEGCPLLVITKCFEHPETVYPWHVQVHDGQANAFDRSVLLVKFQEVSAVAQAHDVDCLVDLENGPLGQSGLELIVLDE